MTNDLCKSHPHAWQHKLLLLLLAVRIFASGGRRDIKISDFATLPPPLLWLCLAHE